MFRHIKLLSSALLFFILILISCKQENKPAIKTEPVTFKKQGVLEIIKDSTNIITLDIEVANDEYERQTGLMYRTSLGEKQGMLFIFETEEVRYFYMKNTYIPLDILFINSENKIVSFAENTEPTDETSLPSQAPVKYVLEINGGLAERWNLETGDEIRFSLSE
ncbi:DUF192 domain-containing protein [Abyssalbus ytuae]|uniref:DUF192 domain-containing protein n=1 Tax=Abyssalbus ytuae TaxID=2926907 RepID=A0A9E6ZWL1_9FLAO|nr:DUF192 domain-containing protein [Abyssalbus ytuae]UOB16537.1 DUF192 domain-containing protein [Abyssalbus ytuae]